jgi:hypothetical protein
MHADEPWIAKFPNEILMMIIQYALCDQEYFDPDTVDVENECHS